MAAPSAFLLLLLLPLSVICFPVEDLSVPRAFAQTAVAGDWVIFAGGEYGLSSGVDPVFYLPLFL